MKWVPARHSTTLQIADCGLWIADWQPRAARSPHSAIRNPQSAFAATARPAVAAPGIAAMTKGSRPSAAHNSSSTGAACVCRAIRSTSACNSSAVIARARPQFERARLAQVIFNLCARAPLRAAASSSDGLGCALVCGPEAMAMVDRFDGALTRRRGLQS